MTDRPPGDRRDPWRWAGFEHSTHTPGLTTKREPAHRGVLARWTTADRTSQVNAPADLLYELLTDAEQLVRWMAATAETDARVGGTIRWTHTNGDSCSGRFVELVPVRRIVFTYGWERPDVQVPPGSTTVEITLEPSGDGTGCGSCTAAWPDRWPTPAPAAGTTTSAASPQSRRAAIPVPTPAGARVPVRRAARTPMTDTTTGEARFWDLAEPLLARPGVERSTMMGLPCLRIDGAFFASCDRRTGDLLVKLPAARVDDLVDSGRAHAFAPAGRHPARAQRIVEAAPRRSPRVRGRSPLMAPTWFAFPGETLAFLADLRSHNTKPWFDANRDRYEADYLDPAKTFAQTIAPALEDLVPGIATEPRVNDSIFRINRDTRFSKDRTPYKDHVDLWFWDGDRKTAVSGLFVRIAPDVVTVGAGAHGLDRTRLARYRTAVADPKGGNELATTVTRLERQGHTVGGETYARTPRGFAETGERARPLRHSALYAHAELPADLATDPELVPTLLRHWRAFAPLHTWLVTNVQ